VGSARRLVVVAVCLALLAGCGKKDERRGYEDDSKIGAGTDIVDGALAAPLRAARQAKIDMFLYSVNQAIQTHAILEGSKPKDLDEVKALWKRESGREWPPPAFRYKYTYDPKTGKVGQVHKRPDEYTPEEREGTGHGRR